MVGQNPPHTYRKDGVFYYCRRIPKDLLNRYDESRIVMSLRTKHSEEAGLIKTDLVLNYEYCNVFLKPHK